MPNAFTDVSNLKIENPYDFDFDGKRNVNVFAYVLCRCYDVILKSEWCKNKKKKKGGDWKNLNREKTDTNPRQCVKCILASRSPTIDYGIDKI